MSAPIVIQAEGISKRYRLGVTDRDMLVDEAAAFISKLRGRAHKRDAPATDAAEQKVGDHFWSLRNVSFAMHSGELMGIVGRNGAGKSTLLKLLSRITLPTQGTIRMRGKVSSLLEVGTGFHPELTGRENILLNGAILGMRRKEIEAKFDRIVAFSGIEHHLDTPIKRYSSGMKVRLGYSVAAHLDPEILIVDEVLSVGDAEFQKKCLGSMREVADSGRTILFVSHNMVSVQSLCSRAIWLDKGQVRMDGTTDEVVRSYLNTYATQRDHAEWAPEQAPGTAEMRVLSVRATSEAPDGTFSIASPIRIEIEVENHGVLDEDLDVRIQVRTHNDVLAFVTGMAQSIGQGLWNKGRSKVTCIIPADLLNTGSYRFQVLFHRQGHLWFRVDDALNFDVHEGARKGVHFHKWPGVVRPQLRWIR